MDKYIINLIIIGLFFFFNKESFLFSLNEKPLCIVSNDNWTFDTKTIILGATVFVVAAFAVIKIYKIFKSNTKNQGPKDDLTKQNQELKDDLTKQNQISTDDLIKPDQEKTDILLKEKGDFTLQINELQKHINVNNSTVENTSTVLISELTPLMESSTIENNTISLINNSSIQIEQNVSEIISNNVDNVNMKILKIMNNNFVLDMETSNVFNMENFKTVHNCGDILLKGSSLSLEKKISIKTGFDSIIPRFSDITNILQYSRAEEIKTGITNINVVKYANILNDFLNDLI